MNEQTWQNIQHPIDYARTVADVRKGFDQVCDGLGVEAGAFFDSVSPTNRTEDTMDIIKRVNSTLIEPDLLIEANRVHVELPVEDRQDMTAWTIEFCKILDEYDVSEKRRHNLLLAINFRLEALAHLENENHTESGGWIMSGDTEGKTFAHEDLFRAAAATPLIEVDGRAGFNPQSFFQCLLRLSEERGSA